MNNVCVMYKDVLGRIYKLVNLNTGLNSAIHFDVIIKTFKESSKLLKEPGRAQQNKNFFKSSRQPEYKLNRKAQTVRTHCSKTSEDRQCHVAIKKSFNF